MLRRYMVLLMFVLQFSLNADDGEKVTVILEANEAPPFWSKKLPQNGMAGEIVYAISEASGIESRIDFKPLSRLIEDDTNNDLGNPSFYMLNQDFADIIPIALYHVSFYYYEPNHKNKLNFKSLKDIRGMKVGVLKGTLIERSYFEQEGILFEESYTHESLFKKLKLGRLDVVIEIELVSQMIIKRLFKNEMDNFVSIPIKGFSHPIAIMLAEDYPNVGTIANKYRKGLKNIIENGTYTNILNKYYTKDKIPNHWFMNLERFNMMYKMDDGE